MGSNEGDVVVVGAGVIGLAIAFELATRGATVRVLDRDEPARAASWAAAGMLAPYSEAVAFPALRSLGAISLAEYPAFAARIQAASGVDVHLRLTGIVRAAYDVPTMEEVRHYAAELVGAGIESHVIDRSSLLEIEPALAPSVVGASVIPSEGYVDNRRLGRALFAACRARRVRIDRTAALRVVCDERRVRGIHTDHGFLSADTVVNACGAWAALLPGVPAPCIPLVEPVKGQMIALAVPSGLVRHATWVPGAYFVPREDGRLLIGATVESAGFDERVTAAGVHDLLHAAMAAAPALSNFAVTETWTGLRPGTPDGLPFLGRTPIEGLLLATGHYRNGILLAPVTARALADVIEKKDVPCLLPFAIGRPRTEEEARTRITQL